MGCWVGADGVRRARRAAAGFALAVVGAALYRMLAPVPASVEASPTELLLGAPVTGWAVGRDRRGDHLGVVTADGRLHVLTVEDGYLIDSPFAPAAELQGGQSHQSWFADHDGDLVLDLTAVPSSAVYSSLAPPIYGSAKPFTAVATSAAGTGIEHVPLAATGPLRGRLPPSAEPVIQGLPYLLRQVPGGGGRCWAVDAAGRRHGALLGRPVAVGDVNECGSDEVLTAESPDEADDGVVFRLYVAQRGRLKPVWQYRVAAGRLRLQGIPVIRYLGAIGDLDCDGQPEVVMADAARGALLLWTWSPDGR